MQKSFSTGLRNAVASTGSLRSTLSGCVIKVYSGPLPASADAALSGNTLLCTYSADGVENAGISWESAPIDGALIKLASEQWQGNAVATGTASFVRICQPADTGASSTTAVRIQGDVGVGGAFLNLTNGTSMASGAPQAILSFSLAVAG
jgi:hypothetical protein